MCLIPRVIVEIFLGSVTLRCIRYVSFSCIHFCESIPKNLVDSCPIKKKKKKKRHDPFFTIQFAKFSFLGRCLTL